MVIVCPSLLSVDARNFVPGGKSRTLRSGFTKYMNVEPLDRQCMLRVLEALLVPDDQP